MLTTGNKKAFEGYAPKKADKEYFKGLIKIYNNFLSDDKCDELIDILEFQRTAEWDGKYYPDGTKTSGVHKGVTANPNPDDESKNSIDFDIKRGLDYVDMVQWLDVNSINLYAEYLSSILMNDLNFSEESYHSTIHQLLAPLFHGVWQIQKYNKDEGHFLGWHIDDNPGGTTIYQNPRSLHGKDPYKKCPIHTPRLAVIMIYLNDVVEGGETEFQVENIKVKPKKGTAMIFPTHFPFYHRGNIPLSSDKYIITSWYNYDPTGLVARIYKDSSPRGWPFHGVPRMSPINPIQSTYLNLNNVPQEDIGQFNVTKKGDNDG